ncbi:DnaJ C-terminal domain-containing protein [Benzoatithermus flavus]|uniref:J domain-containing protein n=1 Tax=Benzoatithermus flavus TaxID=3108223 RepID=A0ABU8XVN2_9PROT
MRDPYEVLGVARDASAEQIRSAYRKLAKANHPDLRPGDKEAEERFKEISAAYELLSDPEKRAKFDRGEIDASGAPRMREHFYRDFAEGPGGAKYSHAGGFAEAADLEEMIQELFGGRGFGGARGMRMRGADMRYHLEVGLEDVVRGARLPVTLADGSTVEVSIPAGVEEGQVLRLKGKGAPGLGGGPPGDALIEIGIRPHPRFERKGADIHLTLPVTLAEAIHGAKIEVPTLHGTVKMTIPKHTSSGKTLRLRGKGLPRAHGHGDQYVRLEIKLPPHVDAELERLIENWERAHPYDPRENLAREIRS